MISRFTKLVAHLQRVKQHPLAYVVVTLSAVVIGIAAFKDATMNLIRSAYEVVYNEFDPEGFKYQNQIISYKGGNGLSWDSAIVIEGALTSDAGEEAVDRWLQHFYPDYRLEVGVLIEQEQRKIEVHHLKSLKTGYERKLYFDVTSFLGTPHSDPENQARTERDQIECLERVKERQRSAPLGAEIRVECRVSDPDG